VDGTGVHRSYFTYDQAIAIDFDIERYQATGEAAFLTQAESLANQLASKLWDSQRGGFVIQTDDWRLSPVFSGWASVSLVHLFQVDQDPHWLELARANLDAIDRFLRDPSTGGYYAACQPDGTAVDGRQETVDQAWMQRAHALVARPDAY
jgi:uncharacterized protein YyaL (SSP411 family)